MQDLTIISLFAPFKIKSICLYAFCLFDFLVVVVTIHFELTETMRKSEKHTYESVCKVFLVIMRPHKASEIMNEPVSY